MELTFITTTKDAPALGRLGSKEMRAHVTKGNFARRRQRMAKEAREHRGQERESDGSSQQADLHVPQRFYAQLTDPLSIVRLGDPDLSVRYLIHNFEHILFSPSPNAVIPGTLVRQEWVQLVQSEPALLESYMSVAMRHRQNDQSGSINPHPYKAVRLISKRLKEGSGAVSDGVLGAVFILAFFERVSNNRTASRVHMDGLAQMLSIRQSGPKPSVPTWFSDMVIHEAVNERVLWGTGLHQRILDALKNTGSHIPSAVNQISNHYARLRQMTELSYKYDMGPGFLSEQIDEPFSELEAQVYALRGDRAYINAFSISMTIFLHLSWARSPLSPVALGDMSEQLKVIVEQRGMALCTSFELTAWQLAVGAIAASEYATRKWLISLLGRYLELLKVRRWDDMFGLLQKTFMPDCRLLRRFKAFWEEIHPEDGMEIPTAEAWPSKSV